ncbi:hypothetical protein ACIGFK_24990 [Streptomyces sp. NPDC085524]|uniref:hypothetical protein n=1 Tax=Streptomyces sp. NPDC085524 TaxID=3365728 RepID=UPI0037D014B0
MTSFATHRRRVHDTALPPYRRLSALRTCLTEFAPYGFRATYHHLCRSAGIPRDLERDPGALVWAVEELHAARALWLTEQTGWESRRRAQKRAGVRVPDPPPPTVRLWCPDPEFHPAAPLPAVMPRLMSAPRAGDLAVCPLCETDRGTTPLRDGYWLHRLCAGCGVSLGRREQGHARAVQDAQKARWKLVWSRTV